MAKLDGVRSNGLLRFLDTNFYFRQPVDRDRSAAAPASVDHRRVPVRGAQVARVPVKVVLTGPYTLAQLSVIATTAYPSLAALTVVSPLPRRGSVDELLAAGARLLQIDEPLILARPGDMRLLARDRSSRCATPQATRPS